MKKLLSVLLLIPTLALAQFFGARVITDSLEGATSGTNTWRIVGTNSYNSVVFQDMEKIEDACIFFRFDRFVAAQDSIDARVCMDVSANGTNWFSWDSTATISDSLNKFRSISSGDSLLTKYIRFRVVGVTGNDADSGSYFRAVYMFRSK